MIKSLVRVTAPTSEPVSLDEAFRFLRVDDSDEGAQIEQMIQVAREMVEDFTGRALMSQTFKLVQSDWPSTCGRSWETDTKDASRISLDRSPLISVESVKYFPASGAAQATLSAATYHALTGPMPGLIQLKYGETWPDLYDRPDAVEVNFTAGYTTADLVPGVLRHAVLLALAHLYEQRQPVNVGNIVNELPMSLKYMLESQRVGGWIA